MDFDPPSALTRFGMFFLAGGIALILALWGILHWIDHPPPALPARPKSPPVIVPPRGTPFSVVPSPAHPAADPSPAAAS